jgi:hypothetical protein
MENHLIRDMLSRFNRMDFYGRENSNAECQHTKSVFYNQSYNRVTSLNVKGGPYGSLLHLEENHDIYTIKLKSAYF